MLNKQHQNAQAQTNVAVDALLEWVSAAQKSLAADKMDSTARARLGELLINACRYLAEREAAEKRVQDKAVQTALPSTIAFNQKLNTIASRVT